MTISYKRFCTLRGVTVTRGNYGKLVCVILKEVNKLSRDLINDYSDENYSNESSGDRPVMSNI